MSFMPWTDGLVLGIETIDSQHRWLVDQTNALHDEITQSTPNKEHIGHILEGLVEYTMNHFILEEEMFSRFGYPETTAHKAEHDKFTATAVELLHQFESGSNVGDSALNLLKNWLQHHIMVVDRAYAPFMKANGVH